MPVLCVGFLFLCFVAPGIHQFGRMQDSMVTQMDLLDDQLSPRGNFLTVQDKDRVIREQRARIDELNQQLANAQQELERLRKRAQGEKSEGTPPKTSRYWTDDEHARFLEAMERYGHKNVKAIAQHVGTRSATQVRTHAQKYFLKLKREREKRSYSDAVRPVSLPPARSSDSLLHLNAEIEVKQEGNSGHWSPNLSASRASYGSPTDMRRKKQRNSWRSHLPEPQELTDAEFQRFSQGLAATRGNKDFDRRCKIIRDLYLSERSIEDVRTWAMLLEKAGATPPDTSSTSAAASAFPIRRNQGLSRHRSQTDPVPRMVDPLNTIIAKHNRPSQQPPQFSRLGRSASMMKSEAQVFDAPVHDEHLWVSSAPSGSRGPDILSIKQEPLSPREDSGMMSASDPMLTSIGSDLGYSEGSPEMLMGLGREEHFMNEGPSAVYVDPRFLMGMDPSVQ